MKIRSQLQRMSLLVKTARVLDKRILSRACPGTLKEVVNLKRIYGFDAINESAYQNLNPNYSSYRDFLKRFGAYFRQIVENVIAGKEVGDGIVIGLPTLFSFQGITHPSP